MKRKIAIATFVKTPGMSPVKTRLAASIGGPAALEFYIRSLGLTYNTIEELKKIIPEVHPYWSLAEKQAIGSVFWAKWPQIWQGEGTLGERIGAVYEQLKKDFDVVALFGADSPHIQADRLAEGLSLIISGQKTSVAGPTEDGGFYFFASSLAVPKDLWAKVTYSTEKTLQDLKNVWPEAITDLEIDFDVDTIEDLNRLNESELL